MEFTARLLIESWILYALGVAIVACRMLSRKIKLGKWKNLAVDDYLMIFALVNFTGVVVSINEVAKNGSNYMPAEAAAALSPAGVDQAVYGSIMTFVLEIFTLTGTWTVKACLLILYHRLTKYTLTVQHKLVKIAAAYCIITYIVVLFMFVFYWCSPTTDYWRVPVRHEQCATYYHHLIFATACNISSDLLLLFIPIPIIIKAKLPPRRKLILCFILGLGVFNILAAVLNRYYNFSNPNTLVFLYWYVAEVTISMLVGNMPLCWPIMRAVFGSRNVSNTPSFHGYTISGGRRHNKKPKSVLSTTVLGSMWDKLGDQEEGGAISRVSHEPTNPSVHDGSQIELVFQGHAVNKHHAAVSAFNSHEEGSQTIRGAMESSSGSSQADTAGDGIRVVTTVDVSTEAHN